MVRDSFTFNHTMLDFKHCHYLDTVFDFDENDDGATSYIDTDGKSELLFAREANQSKSEATPEERVQRSARRQARAIEELGLPASFASLRPVSLPAPSYIRRPSKSTSSSFIDASSSASNISKPLTNGHGKGSTHTDGDSLKNKLSSVDDGNDVVRPFREEIRKHVGADMPSHRGAWAPGSKSWSIFERRRKERHPSSSSPSAIAEEGESTDFDSDLSIPDFSERAITNGKRIGRDNSGMKST